MKIIKKRRKIMKTWFKGFFIFCVVFLSKPAWCDASEIAIIVSKDWSEVTSVDTSDLKQIYLGKKLLFSGKKVKPVNGAKGSVIREKFEKEVLEMTPEKLKKYWIKQGLKGGARPPKSFQSSRIVITYITKVKGAIGYVEQKDLNSNALKEVKVIATLK